MEKDLKIKRFPKVSILIPIYNVEPFIERCSHSLFNQSYENIEYVFVNDCTPDKSIEILQNQLEIYPSRKNQVKIIQHQENKGIGATRNTLIKAATGDYIMWVDSDDFIDENAVKQLVAEIEKTDSDTVTSDCYYLFANESQDLFTQQFTENSIEYIQSLADHKTRAALWGTLSKRSLWTEKNIKISTQMTFAEDYLATVQLFYFSRKIQVVHFPFYYYNQANVNSYTTGYKSENHFKSLILLFEKLNSFFASQSVKKEFELYLQKARITEFSGLLLHTTASLRRKYSLVIESEDITGDFLSKWQKFLLRQITFKRYIFADILLVIAKVLRLIFKLRF